MKAQTEKKTDSLNDGVTQGEWIVFQKFTSKVCGIETWEIESNEDKYEHWIAQVQEKANAEHIVKCVNNFDSLVAALRVAHDTLKMMTLIDKSNTAEKAFKTAEESLNSLNS